MTRLISSPKTYPALLVCSALLFIFFMITMMMITMMILMTFFSTSKENLLKAIVSHSHEFHQDLFSSFLRKPCSFFFQCYFAHSNELLGVRFNLLVVCTPTIIVVRLQLFFVCILSQMRA